MNIKTFTLLPAILIFGTIATLSQGIFKLPKLNVPKNIEEARSSTSPQSKSSDRQIVIDDAFTFFDAEPIEEYNAGLARRVSIGWYLTSSLRMFGSVPNRSGFFVEISKGGRPLAKIRCEGITYRKAEDPVPTNRRNPADDYLMTTSTGCVDKTKLIKETGAMDVAITYFNGQTDEEKRLRTYKIDVREAKRIRGLATAPVPDVSHFYIQRHAETPAAVLFVRPITGTNLSPNYYRIAGDGDFHSEVDIYFNISPQKQVERLRSAVTRCSVNGSPITFPGSGDHADQARFRQMRVETAIYTDRLAPQFKRANEYMDEVSFSLYQVRLPLLIRNDPANNRIGILDRPGDWECSIRINGEPIRTFRWKVGRDGIAQHAEQTSGNVNLNYNGFLIATEIPSGGSSYDHRLLPLPSNGYFYGLPYSSAESRASAAKVPTKGVPYHVPSTSAKP
jgi:hypothetical protein